MHRRPVLIALALLTMPLLYLQAVSAAAQPATGLEQDVREKLRGERALRRLAVAVDGAEVTLTGALDTFWDKHEALRRTLEVEGVETIVSEIELPPPESDEKLAEEVSKVMQRYPHYTVFDYLDGSINSGIVTLMGRVTPDRDKSGELFERVAKIRGVQEVRNEIRTMNPSSTDRRLRAGLANRIFGSSHFERFGMSSNPPFHIIVERSVVTLVGWVQGEIERREMEQIARMTQGVLRVDNLLQTVQ